MGVHGPVHHVDQHLGSGHLDAGNVLADLGVIALVVDQPGGVEHLEAELLDLDPGVGDPVLDGLLLADERALGLPRKHPLAHHVEGSLGHPHRPHPVVDPAAAEAGLGDLEARPLVAQQVLGRHPHVVEPEIGVVAVFQVFGAEAHVGHHFDAGSVGGHQHHG